MIRHRPSLLILIIAFGAICALMILPGAVDLVRAEVRAQVGAWPDPPVRIEPAEGATTSARPTFRMHPVLNGDWYQLQVDVATSFTDPVLDRVVETTYTPISDFAPGTYYWRVRARNVSGQWGLWSTVWRFTVVGGGTGGGVISIGQSVTGVITTADPSHIWRFDGQAGQVVTVHMADTDGVLDSYLELYDPSGALLVADDDSGGDVDAEITNYRLASTGRYTIVARGYGSSTGSYVLILSAGGGVSGRTIGYGQTVTDTLTTDQREHEWTFSAAAGDIVTIAMNAFVDGCPDPWLELRNLSGGSLAADDDSGEGRNALISDYRLRDAGTYIIVAKGWSNTVGAYSLTLTRGGVPQPSPGTIQYGGTVTGSIDASGETDRWTFTGQAGDLVTIDMHDTDGQLDSLVELYDASGTKLAEDDDTGLGHDALLRDFALPRSGTYTIVARGYGNSTGRYELTLTGGGGGTMAYVPAGWFTMGNNEGTYWQQPERQVYLDAFYIDRYEVTNAQYGECARAGACAPQPDDPDLDGSNTREWYNTNPVYANYPVIMATWYDADAYCRWRGARLPTEAEWEKAARWDPVTGESRSYPWGEAAPSPNLLNYGGDGFYDTTEVGSYPEGRSAVGAYDMAGDVWEWVNDWFDDDYYTYAPDYNPTGPSTGTEKVYRGGSWRERQISRFHTSFRGRTDPDDYWVALGFRCARDAD